MTTSTARQKKPRHGGYWGRLKAAGEALKREVEVYRQVLRHPRTPLASKALLGAALGYALMPFDLIPDFVPVIGHLDDLIVVPALVLLALRFVPEDVLAESRASGLAAAGAIASEARQMDSRPSDGGVEFLQTLADVRYQRLESKAAEHTYHVEVRVPPGDRARAS